MTERFVFNKKSLTIFLVILFMPIILYFRIGIYDYCDELLAVISLIYLVLQFIEKKLDKNESQILYILLVIVLLGLVSTIVNRIVTTTFVVMVDMLEFIKTVVVFLAVRKFCSEYVSSDVCKRLTFVAKLIIIIAFVCAVISQVVDIGMTSGTEYGIKSFGFITKNGIQTYWLLTGCLMLLIGANKKENTGNLYIVMYLITTFLTTSVLVWCGDVFLLFFLFYYKRREQLKIRTIVFIALIVFSLSFYEIQKYLFNTDAPRSVLLIYGIKTAMNYFPLGAGFATYGSEMAARYYSPLYFIYGFNNRYGLSNTGYGGILNDNYIAMVVAQFGWIGLLLFGWLFYKMFLMIDVKKLLSGLKPVMMAVFFVIVTSMLISASSKTYIGTWIYVILGMCSNIQYTNTEDIS